MAVLTITQEEIAALLGRPLTTGETSNYELHLDIAKMRLEGLLCFDFTNPENWAEGTTKLPNDLALVWARIFGGLSDENKATKNAGVGSKKVEDFSITYREGFSVWGELLTQNQGTIAKYSKCGSGIRHGETIFACEKEEYDGL